MSQHRANFIYRVPRNLHFIMDYARSAGVYDDPLPRRRLANAANMLHGKIYFKIKKIAIQVLEDKLIDLERDSDTEELDIVRKFIVRCFKLGEKAKNCPIAAKKFLQIMEKLPNRYKLIKLLQNIKYRKIDEGSHIVCLLKLHEVHCQIVESPLCRKYSHKVLPDIMEVYKILDPILYKQIVRHLRRSFNTKKYGVYETIDEAKNFIRNKIKEYRKLEKSISNDSLFYA